MLFNRGQAFVSYGKSVHTHDSFYMWAIFSNSLPLEKAFVCNEILVYKKETAEAEDRLDLLIFKIMLIAQPKNIFIRNTRNNLISDWLVAGWFIFPLLILELPIPNIGDINELHRETAKLRTHNNNTTMLGLQFRELNEIDSIKVDLVPEKKGVILKHVEYNVTSQVSCVL